MQYAHLLYFILFLFNKSVIFHLKEIVIACPRKVRFDTLIKFLFFKKVFVSKFLLAIYICRKVAPLLGKELIK